ncbi:MAG: hypothetical protein JW786_05290 [Desulfobacterales bacterium]|nr:hypothetical protein [Desulfobacterales bacterium]
MKKEIIYSMRMSRIVRDALKKAAKKECRTVASLLDKIITDYLVKEGILLNSHQDKDRRWFARKNISKPADICIHEASDIMTFPSMLLNISIAGVLLSYPKEYEPRIEMKALPKFELFLELTQAGEKVCFNCETRRMLDSGHEILVGATFREINEKNLQLLKTYID